MLTIFQFSFQLFRKTPQNEKIAEMKASIPQLADSCLEFYWPNPNIHSIVSYFISTAIHFEIIYQKHAWAILA